MKRRRSPPATWDGWEGRMGRKSLSTPPLGRREAPKNSQHGRSDRRGFPHPPPPPLLPSRRFLRAASAGGADDDDERWESRQIQTRPTLAQTRRGRNFAEIDFDVVGSDELGRPCGTKDFAILPAAKYGPCGSGSPFHLPWTSRACRLPLVPCSSSPEEEERGTTTTKPPTTTATLATILAAPPPATDDAVAATAEEEGSSGDGGDDDDDGGDG